MDALIGALNNPLVLLLVQLVFGALVKRWSALAAWPNKLIPLFNFILAVLVKLGGPGDANAGVFGRILPGLGSILLQAAVQTVIATGVHSTAKNGWQNLKEVALKSVAGIK
jgi:hypothetical protein